MRHRRAPSWRCGWPHLQTTRIGRALAELGPGAHEAARKFLTAMIDAEGRERVLRLIDRAERARQSARVRAP